MKRYLLITLVLMSLSGFSQNNHIVKTEDGRRVLLKADFTWEYIDATAPKGDAVVTTVSKSKSGTACNLPDDYIEPPLNKKIQAQLKKGRATMPHVKKKVAKKYKCNVDEVILLSASEQKAKAEYKFCVKGKEVAYKRIGTTIIKKEKLF